MRAIGYIRVSTEEQSREGVSLEMQAKKIRAYADLNDLELTEIIRDTGISAKSIKGRPGIQSILQMVKSKKIDAVIVYKLDRLARNTIECLEMAKSMDKAGVALHSISEKLDSQSAIGRFFFTLTASLGEMERNVISERTTAAMALKRSKNERISRHAPFGFEFDAAGNVIENPTEQKIIRKIRELKTKGHSIRSIQAFISAKTSYTNRKGNKFGVAELCKILKNAA